MPANLTEKDFPWMTKELFAGRDVSLLNPRDLPEDAGVDRATVERIHNCSVHCVPLLTGETPMGVLNVGTFDREQGIALDLLQRLRLLGEIFANALARKQADVSLCESEERFRNMVNTARVMIWISGTEKLCMYFNTGWLDSTGRTMEQEPGANLQSGAEPSDWSIQALHRANLYERFNEHPEAALKEIREAVDSRVAPEIL